MIFDSLTQASLGIALMVGIIIGVTIHQLMLRYFIKAQLKRLGIKE